MELEEIREYKVGQIVNNILIINDIYKNITISNNLKIPNEFKINGFLGITHKLENNKLIEIKREEFEVGDIVMFNGNENPLVIIDTYTEKSYKTGELEIVKFYRLFNGIDYADVESERIIKKIGIYGVNFEFINKKILIKE